MAVNKNNVKIHVEHLKKNFGNLEVLRDVSTDIYEGEVVVVLGPSGSGKSTFLRCLNRLEEITGGTVIVDGHDLTDKKTDLNKMRENVGMVFQHFNLFNNLNVMGNMTLAPVELKKATRPEAKEKALQLLDRVGLSDRPMPTRRSCPAGRSSVWPLRARWPWTRTSCCLTSRPRRWTPRWSARCCRS